MTVELARKLPLHRHCERSEAIQTVSAEALWIASSQGLLAMTEGVGYAFPSRDSSRLYEA
jgi:hypothetical protein